MAITLEQIVEEARHWPRERIGELLDRLTEQLHSSDIDHDQAWRQEARRRLAEIEDGNAPVIDGGEVSARIRRIVGR